MAKPAIRKQQILFSLICLLMITETVAIATISKEAAKNVTSSLGETGSITCHLEGNMEVGQELNIFRLVNSTWVKLSTNKVSLNPRKYVFTGEYVLTIRDVSFEDEGWYRCDVTSSHVDQYIKVIDFSSASLSIYWSSATDGGLKPGALVTMTCYVTYSRPPARIRWTKNNNDITDRAHVFKSIADAHGYGDTTSVLTFQLTQSDASAVYRCAADVGDYSNALYDQILIQSEEFSRAPTVSTTKNNEDFQQTNFITEPPKEKNSQPAKENSPKPKEGSKNKTSAEAVLSTSKAEIISARFIFLIIPLFFATSMCVG